MSRSAHPSENQKGTVLALSGGVGGAKLAWGLYKCVAHDRLMVAVNTADDFRHLGLHISPDVDTLTYTLAGVNNRELGWGRRDDTWSFMSSLEALGGETWFALGDRDLAIHIERTRRLDAGESLSQVTDSIRRSFGISARLAPMSNDPVKTRVRTPDGWLDFQDYFVRRRCAPKVQALMFAGAEAATPNKDIVDALADPDLRAVVICPSNPFISILPILSVPGIREALSACNAPRIAISPIINGIAVKGPTAKMMTELGYDVSSVTAARQYVGLLDAFVVDEVDAKQDHGVPLITAPTLMNTDDDKIRLAARVLMAGDDMAVRKRQPKT